MTDLIPDKGAERKRAAARRKMAHEQASDPGQALIRHMPGLSEGAAVSGYLPIRSEIDPVPLMTRLFDLGHPICVPVIEAQAAPLKFRAWSPDAALIEGAYGAAIPETGDWVEPDVLLVPLLSFDRRGFRLGYGGGFYDRTLQELRANKTVMAIGLAYADQEVDAVPIEPTDQRLDAILTEQGLIEMPTKEMS